MDESQIQQFVEEGYAIHTKQGCNDSFVVLENAFHYDNFQLLDSLGLYYIGSLFSVPFFDSFRLTPKLIPGVFNFRSSSLVSEVSSKFDYSSLYGAQSQNVILAQFGVYKEADKLDNRLICYASSVQEGIDELIEDQLGSVEHSGLYLQLEQVHDAGIIAFPRSFMHEAREKQRVPFTFCVYKGDDVKEQLIKAYFS